MKQAILITAYKDAGRLRELVGFFGDGDFEFYIHVDKKCPISDEECTALAALPNVAYVSRKYKVNWGGMNHLKCVLLLARQALKNTEIGYIHTISGSDYPVKSPEYFKAFAEGNRKEYLENFTVPASRWYKGGMNRVEYYHPMDLINIRDYGQLKYYYRFLGIQEKLGMKRSYSRKLPPLHGGSIWWSLTYDCVKYVVGYTSAHPRLLRRLKYAFIPEEFYFQTVIMSSPFAANVVNDHLRYIDWNERNGNCPAVLDMTDIGAISESMALFARKLESPVSDELLNHFRETRKGLNGDPVSRKQVAGRGVL